MSLVIEDVGIGLTKIASQKQMSGLFEIVRFSKVSEIFEVCPVSFDGFDFAAAKERGQEARRG
jgi:hypothetical protein